MRPTRFRFTVRRMMIAVAVVAIVCYLGLLVSRRWLRLDRSVYFAAKESTVARWLEAGEGELALARADLQRAEFALGYDERLASRGRAWNDSPAVRDRSRDSHRLAIASARFKVESAEAEVARSRKLVEFARRQKGRYERAAASPWLSLDPEPAEPK